MILCRQLMSATINFEPILAFGRQQGYRAFETTMARRYATGLPSIEFE